MSSIDEVLEFNIFALEASVHLAHVQSMIAMIVIARRVLDNGSDPDGGESKSLDVVEFLYQTFEVAAPFWVLIGDVAGLVSVPAVGVFSI